MRTLKLAIVGLMTATMLAACQQGPPVAISTDAQVLPGQPGPGLVADPHSPVADVPMPIGFRLVKTAGHDSPAGASRRIQDVYQGVGSAADAVRFYRQNLPRFDWKPVAVGSAPQDASVLRYTKKGEHLTIGIVHKGGVDVLYVDIVPAA